MTQFVVGIYITVDVCARVYPELSGLSGACANPKVPMLGQCVLYSFYLVLFANFFANAYCKRPTDAPKKDR